MHDPHVANIARAYPLRAYAENDIGHTYRLHPLIGIWLSRPTLARCSSLILAAIWAETARMKSIRNIAAWLVRWPVMQPLARYPSWRALHAFGKL